MSSSLLLAEANLQNTFFGFLIAAIFLLAIFGIPALFRKKEVANEISDEEFFEMVRQGRGEEALGLEPDSSTVTPTGEFSTLAPVLRDGRLELLDPESQGGTDHSTLEDSDVKIIMPEGLEGLNPDGSIPS